MSSHYKNNKGFTLAEAMLAMVILGFAAAGVLLPFSNGAAVQAEGQRKTLAAKLAANLMDEVVDANFSSIVANYNYTESKGQVTDAEGNVFSGPTYTNFSREVISQYYVVPQESGMNPPQFVHATVKVYYSGRETAVLSRLIGE